jgi:predicted DNA-binding WGR domain protein
MTRRFEFIEGSSPKFWEITTSDTSVTVRYGRIGTSGQEQTKTFPDQAAADKHANKLISEKTGKGYVELAAK